MLNRTNTLTPSGKQAYGTMTRNGVPTIKMIEILLYAFRMQRADLSTEAFDDYVIEDTMVKFGLKKYPQCLMTYERLTANTDRLYMAEIQGRTLAFDLYQKGVKNV